MRPPLPSSWCRYVVVVRREHYQQSGGGDSSHYSHSVHIQTLFVRMPAIPCGKTILFFVDNAKVNIIFCGFSVESFCYELQDGSKIVLGSWNAAKKKRKTFLWGKKANL